jgi:hypothetical protein
LDVTASAGAVRQAASASEHWDAWVDNKERLLRIATVMQEQVDLMRNQVGSREQSSQPSSGTDQGSSGAGVGRSEPHEVVLAARQKALSLRQIGPPQAVLAQVENDLPSLVGVTLSFGGARRISAVPDRFVDFSDFFVNVEPGEPERAFAGFSLDRSTGATLQIGGNNPTWVRGAFEALKDEVNKGVPRWSRLRSTWMWWPYTILGILVWIFALRNVLDENPLSWFGLAVALGIASGTGLTLISKSILPGFEILSSGRSAKGGRVLGVFFSVATNIAIGALVNILTRE